MNLSCPSILISDDEGFNENDIFKRKPFADKLTEIIKNCDDGLVIAIDAPWGAGKTTFVQMWRGSKKTGSGLAITHFYFSNYSTKSRGGQLNFFKNKLPFTPNLALTL
jgi:hypothetical protein